LLTTTTAGWRRLGRWGSGGGGDRRRRLSFGGGACRSVRWGKEKPGRGVPCAGGAGSERKCKGTEEMLTDGEGSGWPAWRGGGTPWRRRMWERRGRRASGRGSRRGSRVDFIGRGGREGAATGVMAINGHGGLDCIKGERLIGEETEGGVKGGGGGRCFRCS
jgi:hypothetical protein